jgi:hypothetical protein
MPGYLSLAASAALLSIASTASAEDVSARCGGFTRYAADALLCDSAASVRFRSAGPEVTYAIRISVPAAACSDTGFIVQRARALYRRDAPAGIAYTYRLRPGQSQTVAIGAGYGEGEHVLRLSAIRYDGACTGRAAMSWSASVMIAPVAS